MFAKVQNFQLKNYQEIVMKMEYKDRQMANIGKCFQPCPRCGEHFIETFTDAWSRINNHDFLRYKIIFKFVKRFSFRYYNDEC